MNNNVCKICRRQGQKLFLKGEKCFTPKCPFIKRPYPPGIRSKRKGRFNVSEYSKELSEKQKLRNYYGLREKQFAMHVHEAMAKGGKNGATLFLVKKLEGRLSNVVFKMGLARSRREARELVSHGHFLINGKPVNISSFNTKKGMKISLKPSKKDKTVFKNLIIIMKNYQAPSWLKIDFTKLEGEITGEPTLEDVGLPVDIPSIFEFYSR